MPPPPPPVISADISPTLGSIQATVTEEVSNPQVGFDPTSVNATVNDSKYCTDLTLKGFSDCQHHFSGCMCHCNPPT